MALAVTAKDELASSHPTGADQREQIAAEEAHALGQADPSPLEGDVQQADRRREARHAGEQHVSQAEGDEVEREGQDQDEPDAADPVRPHCLALTHMRRGTSRGQGPTWPERNPEP